MNSLKHSQSPYLLQHKDNPVNWYPWSDEAFEKAKDEDKPIFLSIGYATCHWCHVMAHESFEDETVAELMNEAFINIKVDREERPDIDNTYMTVCQMLTGRGGWPLTIVMTPDKEPFFAGTYLPKESRGQQLGMLDLIPQIQSIWEEERDRINQSVESIRDGFNKSLSIGTSRETLPEDAPDKAAKTLSQQYDETWGGFGSQPKFPSPHNLMFLFNYSESQNDQKSREMALHTLRKMRLGGIWDHVGGGFHRYSTDQKWLLPHFEKMLYDQAMLLLAYTEGWRISGEPIFRKTSYQIFEYLTTRMRSSEGGFFSAEDADSEGEEGKYYIWKKSELFEHLQEDDAALFCDLYNIREEGNFRDEASGELTGNNIPHLHQSIEAYALRNSKDPDQLSERLDTIRSALYSVRNKRVSPLLDDKILTDWNGLLMAAFATAGAVFDDEIFTSAARDIEQFIRASMVTDDGSLLHRFRNGDAGIEAMADDYSCLVWGLIELYETTLDPYFLSSAVDFQNEFREKFKDSKHGGFYFTSDTSLPPLSRQKEIYDGALPSSNSIAALNGFRLSRLTGQTDYETDTERIFTAFSDVIADRPSGYTFALLTRMVQQSDPCEIAITAADKVDLTDVRAVLSSLNRLRNSVLLKTDQTRDLLDKIAPFTKPFNVEKDVKIYVCRNFSCDVPVNSVEKFRKLIS